jgi:hypothetical protein
LWNRRKGEAVSAAERTILQRSKESGMQHKRTLTSCLALAAAFGIGVAAAPVALDSDLELHPNAATAQASGGESDSNDGGDSGNMSEGTAGGAETNPGVAEERATAATTAIPDDTADNVYEILGTTREEAESADMQTSASAQYGPLDGYQTEVERGNLDAAAKALANIADKPITQEMVTEVNTELGVDTTLSDQQIAEAAARKQDGSN